MNKFHNQVNDQKPQGGEKKAKQMVEIKGNPNLPHDLIFEILSRLPPKAISKFRCVSKQWYHLLSNDKEFTARHVEWSKKNPVMLMRKYTLDENGEMSKNKATIELTSVDMRGNVTDKFKIIVDGLVHTFISCGPMSIVCSMNSLYVCNPSFHENVRVPYRSRTHLQNIGIGYDLFSSEYKIVHLFEKPYLGGGNMECEVLTFRNADNLSSGSWRRISGVCPWSACTEKFPLCVSGNIYWARSSGAKNKSILSFNLEKEEFSTIDYPSCDPRTYSFLEFTGIKGSLSVIGCSLETSTMDVWQLDKDEKTWVMEHCISRFPFAVNFLVSSDNQSEEIVIHTDQKGLIIYNIKNRSSRRIKYYEGVRSYNKPCLYHYTLSPLHTTIFRQLNLIIFKNSFGKQSLTVHLISQNSDLLPSDMQTTDFSC